MDTHRRITVLLLMMALLLNGCLAAAPILIPAVGIAVSGGYIATVAINSARTQHPNINFDKKYPNSETYNSTYDTTYQKVVQAVIDLNEQTDRTDKQAGIIDTKKAEFGEKPSAIQYGLGKKVFYQRKLILVKSISEKQTQVSVKVKFSRKGGYTEEAEFDDTNAENVVRAILFDKLDQLLGKTISR